MKIPHIQTKYIHIFHVVVWIPLWLCSLGYAYGVYQIQARMPFMALMTCTVGWIYVLFLPLIYDAIQGEDTK